MFGTNIEETVTNDNANNDDTDNVTTNVVNEEDHPELLDSRGGSHVTNVPQLDVEDFSSWKDSHEGPSKTRDTKIAPLRLKFNVFKALEGEKVQQTYTRLKILLNELENKDVKISQVEDIDSDVEEDTKSSIEFLADLNLEFHDRVLLANQKRFYKRSRKDEELLSSKDEGTTTVKAFIAIAEDEPVMGKTNARSVQNLTHQHEVTRLNLANESLKDDVSDLKKVIEKLTSGKVSLDQLLSEQVPGNIVRTLSGRGKQKDNNSPKDIVFLKAEESLNENSPESTSKNKSVNDNQEPLPPLPKVSEAEPISTSKGVTLLLI
ncbi:hypothetical protein Tco_0111876 [Tanacetum coccineum]